MLLTQEDVSELVRFSTRITATKLKIEDAEWKSTSELLDEIPTRNQETFSLLVAFHNAYQACFKKWTPQNIERRDQTRNALLENLNNL